VTTGHIAGPFGRRIVARELPEPLLVWLRRSWSHGAGHADDPVFTVEISLNPDAPAIRAGGLAVPLGTGMERGRQERDGLWIGGQAPLWWFRTRHGSGEVRVEGGGARVELHAREPVPDDDATPFYEGLFLLLTTALSASGLVPLHAAAACPPGSAEGAWILPASSGTGKSTTLLRLAAAGWMPVMEDFGWLDPETEALQGWDGGIRVHDGTQRRFATALASAPWRPDRDGKLLLPYEALGAPTPRRAAVARVVLLERDPTRAPGWRDARPRDVVRSLWESAGALLPPSGREAAGRWIARRARGGHVRWFNLAGGAVPQDWVAPAHAGGSVA
jgi:hypothetical protein